MIAGTETLGLILSWKLCQFKFRPYVYFILQVSCGPYHAAAITNDGRLFTWGDGLCGKLGHPTSDDSAVPRAIDALSGLRVRFNDP